MTFCIDAGTPETKRETLKTSGAFTLSVNVNTASVLRQRLKFQLIRQVIP